MGRGGGLRPCSSVYSPPGLVWCYFGSGRPEEVGYLVPEANIRLRPVGKYPLGCRGRGHLSVAGVLWHTWLVPLSHSVPLYLSIAIVVQPRSTCFWLILCPHSMFSATGHTVQRSRDQIAVLPHHHTAQERGTEEESAAVGLKECWQPKSTLCFSIQSHFMQMTHKTAFSTLYISIQASQWGMDENSKGKNEFLTYCTVTFIFISHHSAPFNML